MTPARQQHPQEPLDCDHEPVCWKFRYDKKQQQGMLEFCCRNDCIKWYIGGQPKPDTEAERLFAPSTSAPAPVAIPLKQCFGRFDDCPCDDECSVSEFCAEYCKQKEVNSCGMTESQCGFVREHEKTDAAKAEREQVLPTEQELHAIKHAVCEAIAQKTEGFELADNYYHKLKSLRAQQEER